MARMKTIIIQKNIKLWPKVWSNLIINTIRYMVNFYVKFTIFNVYDCFTPLINKGSECKLLFNIYA